MNSAMPRSRRLFAAIGLLLLALFWTLAWLALQWPAVKPHLGTATVVSRAADLRSERADAINASPSPEALAAAPGPAPAQPPGRLIIRSIGVNAPVVAVGVDKSGAMDVTKSSYDTGWYKLGPAPGDPGDAVIDGHLDWYDTSRAVFYNLRDLRVGDDIEVQRLDGVSHHFTVTGIQTVAYNATVPGLFAAGGPARLSLITCGGPWSKTLSQYLERVVVDSALVG